MALHGTLQDFGALETFQLIALQQKTGTLEITHGGERRAFGFENGHLLGAHETPLRIEDPLVRFLCELGYLKEEEARAWIAFPSPQPTNPVDLLVKLTDLTEEDIATIYDGFLQTTLDELLSWPQGRFQFHTKKVGIPSRILGPWKLEGLLMESMRRIDEFANLQAAELAPGLIPKLPDGRSRPQPEDRFARALIRRIDGRRSIQDIIGGSALAGYDLCQAMRKLRDDGLVEMIEWIPSGPWMETLWRQRSRWKSLLYGTATAAMLVLLTLGVHAFLNRHPSPWPAGKDASFMLAQARLSRAAQVTAELMEVYHLRHGRYPPSYATLEREGLLSSSTRRRLERSGLRWTARDGGSSYRWVGFGHADPEPAPGASHRTPPTSP
jgi:hypothetical protein